MGLFGRKNSDGKPALLLDVVYVGGHAQWPEPGVKTLTTKIKLELHSDHLKFKNTNAFGWFKELKILYNEINDIIFIESDTVTQLEYNDTELGEIKARFQFFGFTKNGQSQKCGEFRDFLKQNDHTQGLSLASDNHQEIDDDCLGSYEVFYKGGHPDMTHTDIGVSISPIQLEVFDDYFRLKPTELSIDWFDGTTIQHNNIIDVKLIQSLSRGRDADLKTVIQIDYDDEKHDEIQIRLEMKGFTNSGAAKKCAEFEDCLRNNKVKDKFKLTEKTTKENVGVDEDKNNFSEDVFAKIERLSKLREDGILSEKEFEEKKQELLSQI